MLAVEQNLELLEREPLLGDIVEKTQDAVIFQKKWDFSSLPYILEYKILGYSFVAGAVFIEMALAAIAKVYSSTHITLGQMRIENTLLISKDKPVVIYLLLKNDGYCEIYTIDETAKRVVHATFQALSEETKSLTDDIVGLEEAIEFNIKNFYEQLKQLGVDYGLSFRPLKSVRQSKKSAIAEFHFTKVDNYFVLPTLIYGGFQLFTIQLAYLSTFHNVVYLPVGIEKIEGYYSGKPITSAKVVMHYNGSAPISSDLFLYDEDGHVVLKISNFLVKEVPLARFMQQLIAYAEKPADSNSNVSALAAIKNFILTEFSTQNTQEDKILNKITQLSWIIIVWATRIVDIFTL